MALSFIISLFFSFSYPNLYVFFSAVIQRYEVDVVKEYVIVGNDGVLKCKMASFVADYLSVVSWRVDDKEILKSFEYGNLRDQIE